MVILKREMRSYVVALVTLALFGLTFETQAAAYRQANQAYQARASQRRQMGPAVANPNLQSDKKNFLRACYFTNWAQYRPGKGKFTPEDYEPGLCTHILYAFGWMNTDFTVRAYDPADLTTTSWQKGMYQRVNDLKEVDPELKTLLSIGGWTFGTELFKTMASSPKSRKIFIDSALSFVRLYKFDGLDIDWEYPQGPDDRKNFALLVKEMYEAFAEESSRTSRPRLLLAAAVSAAENTIDNGYDIPELAKYLDFVDVMTYDFHGAWEAVTGMNSPLRTSLDETDWNQRHWNVEWAIKHWHERGMPPEKILIGLPTYGRGWTVTKSTFMGPGATADGASKATEFVQEPGVAAYYELCQMLENGAARKWDDRHQAPYLTYQDQWFSYDDADSYRKKIQWVKDNGYGGVFMWTLDFDDFGGFCSSSRGKRYPLIGLVRDLLADGARSVAHFGQYSPPPASSPTTTTVPQPAFHKATWKPVTFSIERPPPLSPDLCQGSPDGFFPYPGAACNHFLLCLRGAGYGMSCPPALEFGPTFGYCVRPPSGCSQPRQQQQQQDGGLTKYAPVHGGHTPPAPTPAAATPAHIDPVVTPSAAEAATSERLQYYKGQHGAGAARLPSPVVANSQAASSSISNPDDSSSRHPPGSSATFICPMDGFHPDPTDCARFYRCFISIPYEFHCPDGLLYNIETQVCDAPMNVQCTH